tara:strand:- start:140 stop:271 length:132 start_codon:yes stop_codon:yes gene_type:complete
VFFKDFFPISNIYHPNIDIKTEATKQRNNAEDAFDGPAEVSHI